MSRRKMRLWKLGRKRNHFPDVRELVGQWHKIDTRHGVVALNALIAL
jgi:hypothetical protein